MRRTTMTCSRLLAAFAALTLAGTAARAAAPLDHPNGDQTEDLAPLQSGNTAQGPVASQNTPPIGGATQAGGGNPKESGAVDSQRAQSRASGADKIQPDNK